jgi:two-component system, OmpR family, KDP operon response regulator KdpE
MILDLGLPDIDGRQVIRDVRLTSSMPILVLSGRTEDSEKIAALEQGADDYITKPFAVRDLVGRVQAALNQKTLRDKQDEGSVLTGDLDIGLEEPAVKRAGHAIELEDEEYELLRLLALHGGRVLTYGHIVRSLWGKDGASNRQRDLQKRVNTLRHKLENEPAFPRYIVTEPAVGYRLEILPATESLREVV